MIAAPIRAAADALLGLGAVSLFVLSPAIGSIASVIAVVVAILISTVTIRRDTWSQLRAQPALLIFLACFLSLGVCYEATAQHPTDVLLVINFLALPLSPVVYLAALRFPGERTIRRMATLFAASSVVAVLMGIYDVVIRHHDRAVGIAQGGNLMARTVILLGFMGMAGVFVTPPRRWWIYVGGLLLSTVALSLTQTRGVFIAVPALGLIVIWALMQQFRAPALWYGVGGAVVVGSVVLIGVLSPRFLGLAEVFGQLARDTSHLSDSSSAERLYLWHAGWVTFLKSPLIGFGWANFTQASLPFGIYFYHNDFLDMAVAAGLVGIGCWLAIIVAPLIGVRAVPYDGFHTARLYCALILSTSLLVFGLTDMTLGYDLPTTLYAFLTALVLGAFRE